MKYYDPAKVGKLLDAIRNLEDKWELNLTEPWAYVKECAAVLYKPQSPPPVKIVVEIEGGVLQDYTANVPIELYRFDFDNIEDGDHDHADDAEPEKAGGSERCFKDHLNAMLSRCEEIKESKKEAEPASEAVHSVTVTTKKATGGAS
jgi:hypothetical protein